MLTVPKPANTATVARHSIVSNVSYRSAHHLARRRFGYYFFFFGASTMIIWRPSIFGICST
jgi:hypothetical protein